MPHFIKILYKTEFSLSWERERYSPKSEVVTLVMVGKLVDVLAEIACATDDKVLSVNFVNGAENLRSGRCCLNFFYYVVLLVNDFF